ncbi:hypothetical protein B0H10DRAFT_2197446 [Mycena sp. CBHHK59/15]|nr:hypothetical protein B0H10DRAFT_2197446 [Mycena sp. CBHHK59/15]
MSFEDATDRSRWVKVNLRGIDGPSPLALRSSIERIFGRGTRVERVLIENESLPITMRTNTARGNEGPCHCVGSVDLSTSDPKHQKTITAALREGGNAFLDRCHDRSSSLPLASPSTTTVRPNNLLRHSVTPSSAEALQNLTPRFYLEVVEKGSKDITGTYPFMSLVALRHMKDTRRTRTSVIMTSNLLLSSCLDPPPPRRPRRRRDRMLASSPIYPYHTLIDTLTLTFILKNPRRCRCHPRSVLSAFDTALASLDWPKGDAARKFIPPLASLPPLINAGTDASYTSSRHYWKDAAKGAVAPQPSTSGRAPEGTAGASGSVKRKRDDKTDRSTQVKRGRR